MTIDSHDECGLRSKPFPVGTGTGTAGAATATEGVPSEVLDRERELVARLLANDSAAWLQFVQQYQRLILSRVLATARETNHSLATADAEDLCAEVFSKLVEREFAMLRGFEGRSTLATWLSVITRRTCLRRLALAWRELSRPGAADQPELERVACRHDDPLSALLRGERHARVRDSLCQLSARDQQLVRFFFLDGCSYREISQQLDMPINSIGPTLQRIQARLRKLSGLDESTIEA